jgi:tetratricopeptide (TPR) repeat protein
VVSAGGGEAVIRSPATGKNALDKPHSPNPSSNLLSASVSPSIFVPSDDPEVAAEVLAEDRELIVRALADFDGCEIDVPGDEVVAEFPSPDKAVSCALQMQSAIDQNNADRLPTARSVLAVGIHHSGDAADEESCRAAGLRVVSTLRKSALRVLARTGGVFISEDIHARVRSRKELQFQDVGSWTVEGEAEPIQAYEVVLGGTGSEALAVVVQAFSRVRGGVVFGILGAMVVVGIMLSIDFSAIQIGDVSVNKMWESPPDSIAVLPFDGGGFRPNGESYRDTIPARIIDALEQHGGIKVASRSDSFAFRDRSYDVAVVGESLEVEGVVTGYANASGDWLLVRIAILKVSDRSEVWSAAYYRRASEIEQILDEMLQGIAGALDLHMPRVAGTDSREPSRAREEADFVTVRGDLEDALKQAQRLDIGDEDRVISLNNLASLYYDSGRDDEAIPLYREVLRIRERTLGPQHPEVAVSLNNLASAYLATGRHADAEALYLRSLEIRQEALGADHPRVANAYNNLASLYHRQGRFEEAETLYRRALEIREREIGLEPDPSTVRLQDQAVRYQLGGQFPQAQNYYEQALTNERNISGDNSPRTASATRDLAVVHGMQGNSEASGSLFQQAIALFSGSLGDDHPEVGRTLGDLGELHRRGGRLVDAEVFHEKSLKVFERSLGPEHPEVAGALSCLVAIFEIQDRDEEASEARKRAKKIRDSYLGPVFSYVTARSAGERVVRDRVQDSLSEPQPVHEYLVVVDQGGQVVEKQALAESLHNMALLYAEQGRYAEAETQSLRALSIRESISGRTDPEVAMSLHTLARIYTMQGRFTDADQHYEEAIRIFETRLGPGHPHVARCLEDFAGMLRSNDRAEQAEEVARRARDIRAALKAQQPSA